MPVIETRTLYAFDELTEDAQERAIEQWRSHTANWFDFSDIEMATDEDYWSEEKLEPLGFTLSSRSVSYGSGKSRNEAEIYWSTNPDWLVFAATIDVPIFMRAMKMAGKYRALYVAATRGDIDASVSINGRGDHGTIEAEYTGVHPGYSRYIDGQWVSDSPRMQRIEAQLSILEDALEDAYSDLCGEWIRSIVADIDYQYSDEYIRESLENCYTEAMFCEDGFLIAP